MGNADIAIVGTGSLAAKAIHSLSQLSDGRLRVAVIGRSRDKVSRITQLAEARSQAFGRSTRFVPVVLAQFQAREFRRILRSLRPKVIFHAASIQSPWEGAQRQDGWTQLVASAGFGVTLPLQLTLVAEVCRGAEDSNAAIVNASYPDCVNVVLAALGMRVTCGIGNSAIVEAFCRAHEQGRKKDIRVIAHHGHLGGWLKGDSTGSQPRLWVGKKEMASRDFRPDVGGIGEELNDVTSATAVAVMVSLLTGAALETSLPGVEGLPGGYPFQLKRGKFKMRLPAGLGIEEAIAHNRSGERQDGIELGAGVRFCGQAEQSLKEAGFEYAEGFDFAEWTNVRDKILVLRERLRRANPADSSRS